MANETSVSSKLYKLQIKYDKSDAKMRCMGIFASLTPVTETLEALHGDIVEYQIDVADVQWTTHVARKRKWIDV